MRILYIVPFVPWPVRVRSFNLIPRLARRHEVHLVCMAESPQALFRLDGLRTICNSVSFVESDTFRGVLQSLIALPTPKPLRLAYCASPKMTEAVRRAIQEGGPDVIYVERWRALQYVPKDIRIPVVCDPTDSMILYNRRLSALGTWWERPIGLEEYVKFLRAEPLLARRANATIFCSHLDLECVVRRAPGARCELVPNGVDCQTFFLKRASESEAQTIIFTGSFAYRPNCHAVGYFVQEILPLVRKALPNVRFRAVGNEASRHLKRFEQPGFEAEDFVTDLRTELGRATVAVAPITVGSGVSNKLLEAFATGTPIVGTSMACGDLPVRHGEHLLVADDPKRFAEGVVSLIRDAELREHLTVPAHRLVVERYDWEVVYRQLENILFSVVREAQRHVTATNGVRVPKTSLS